jgi:hypothetical protein
LVPLDNYLYYRRAVMAVPTMSEGALGFVIEALQDYRKREEVRVLGGPDEYLQAEEELIRSGLDERDAQTVLLHMSTIDDFLPLLTEALTVFKKVNKLGELCIEKQTKELEEKKKELEKARALVARLVAKVADLEASDC